MAQIKDLENIMYEYEKEIFVIFNYCNFTTFSLYLANKIFLCLPISYKNPPSLFSLIYKINGNTIFRKETIFIIHIHTIKNAGF